jgi:hypothetical protein
MPAPTSYTEQSLAEFMRRELRATATELGWTDASGDNYIDATEETLLAYGATDIAEATDILKLRGLARVSIWEQAVKETVPAISHSADGASFSDDQLYQHCLQQLDRAKVAAQDWLTEFVPSISLPNQVVW